MLRLIWQIAHVIAVIPSALSAVIPCQHPFESQVRILESSASEVSMLLTKDDKIELRVPEGHHELWHLRAKIIARHVFATDPTGSSVEEDLLLAETDARKLNAESVTEMNQLANSIVPSLSLTHDQLWLQLAQQTRKLRQQRQSSLMSRKP